MKPTALKDNKNKSQTRLPPSNPFPPNFPFNSYQLVSNLKQSERILENYKIITWDNNFQYTKIHISDLDSIFVNTNPFFQELVSLISAYNEKVEAFEKSGTPLINGPWLSHFFVKLHNVLLEIIFTKNRTLQNYFIETVHSWALDQISRLNGPDTSSSKPQSISQRPLTGSTNITRPQSGFPEKTPLDKFKPFMKRPGSAIISQGAIRPVSGVIKMERPVSGALQNEKTENENPASGSNYKYIRPLSGWNRPLSSITRPWSSTSGEMIENLQENEEEKKDDEVEEFEQEQIYEVNEEEGGEGEEEEVFNEKELLPSQFIKNMMKDYQIGARTKIDYVDAPYERLKNYNRKNLLQIKAKTLQLQNKESTPKDEKPEIILYDKPMLFLQQQQKYREQKEEEQKQAEVLKAAAAAEKKLKEGDDQDMIPEKKPSAFGKSKKKKRVRKKKKEYPFKAALAPDHKPFQDDDLFQAPRILTARTHLQNKFETKSTFLHYQPSDNPRELNMELKWFHNRNKELNEKRNDEEMVTMMKEWSSNKERIDAEISRKIQSEYEASQFQKIEYKPNPIEEMKKPQTNISEEDNNIIDDEDSNEDDDKYPTIIEKKRPFSSVLPRTYNFNEVKSKTVKNDVVLYDVSGLEDNKAKRKIDDVRKLLGGNINASNREEEDKGKMPKSLSIYSNAEKKMKARPFSAFLQSQKPGVTRNEQMFEIDEIKEKMARYKLSAKTKVLVNALLVPEGLNDQNKLMKLPMPGSDLIINPFAEKKKTRKKKGKKKKKKY